MSELRANLGAASPSADDAAESALLLARSRRSASRGGDGAPGVRPRSRSLSSFSHLGCGEKGKWGKRRRLSEVSEVSEVTEGKKGCLFNLLNDSSLGEFCALHRQIRVKSRSTSQGLAATWQRLLCELLAYYVRSARGAPGVTCTSGSTKVKADPSPRRDVTEMEPWCARTSVSARDRPRPVPPRCATIASPPCSNAPKMTAMRSAGMPMPDAKDGGQPGNEHLEN